jgi:hypothetical protein
VGVRGGRKRCQRGCGSWEMMQQGLRQEMMPAKADESSAKEQIMSDKMWTQELSHIPFCYSQDHLKHSMMLCGTLSF